jgi:DNA repair photolyase
LLRQAHPRLPRSLAGARLRIETLRKADAAALLRRELANPRYVCAPIAIGTNTDPYQPIEARWRIMRSIVEVLAETSHPLFITTKSDRVTRDIDLLAAMAEKNLVSVALSVTSLTPEISRTLEPRAPAARKRLAAVKMLSEAGIPTTVAIAPVVPGITDCELEQIVEAAAEAGARGIFYLPVRLPFEVAPLFRAWLDEHFQERAGKVMSIIQSLRGGRDNDPNWFTRMRGQGHGRTFRDALQDRDEEAWLRRRSPSGSEPTSSSRRRGRS